jgi:hypothetical protein
MRKPIRAAAVVALAASSLTGLAALGQPAEAATTCTAIDAPKKLNIIPASSDCEAETKSGLSIAAVTPVAPATVISSTPKSYSRTDGDILAITKVNGAATNSIAIGGNFKHVITPDGVSHAATNFAILNESTGAVLYAGNANSYVRAIASYNGVTYLGGDFTSFGGSSRTRTAALSASYSLMSWNPAPGSRVRGMAADSSGVYLTGDFGALRKVGLSSSSTIWSKSTTSGPGRAVVVFNGSVYCGGLFETYAGTTRHGLVKVSPSTGAIDTAFNANLRADTGVGSHGSYDGEGVLALSAGTSTGRLLLGIGGNAPSGLSSNEIIVVNSGTGARIWRQGLIGDGQAVATVGATDVVGYHRNASNGSTPWPYFAAQYNDSNGALTTWDPKITGNQSNADGGNNGVQGMYADPATKTLFLAGAFTMWNGTSSHKSLIAFSWT